MAKLKLNHIYKVYEGGVRAVNDFNLDIKDKEFVVFVGPSGCGKSTTLRMIAGLEDITAGQLYIDDNYVNETDSKDRDIAMVFQSYALYPHMSVYQNMAFGLKLRRFDKMEIDRRVKEAAEILEITDLLSRKPKALSGGQRQRVALGRAIVREPKVFLLDEPLSNLDAKLRVQMRTEITKLHKKLATTFIYVTHDQTEAMTMGDRIVVMKGGYIQQVDSPINLYENPANLFVATFLGSPQMNIMKAKLTKQKDSLAAMIDGKSELSIEIPELTAKQLRSHAYIEKDVYLGIRPEHLSIANKGIPAVIDVYEQLGDQTIVYAKIVGTNNTVLIKTNTNSQYVLGSEIFINFDMSHAHMFDIDSERSILGMPFENSFDVEYDNGIIKFGDQHIVLHEDVKSHILDRIAKSHAKLTFLPEDIYLKKEYDHAEDQANIPSVKIDCKIAFIEKKPDRTNCFATVSGVEGYLAFSLPLSSEVHTDDTLSVYIDQNKLVLKDETGMRLTSHEVVTPNIVEASIVHKDGNSIIKFGKNTLIVSKLNIEEGVHNIKIHQDKVRVIFNKKVMKDLKVENPENINPHLTLKVSAYDEDLLGNHNAIFVALKGLPGYFTFVVENNFSVYKMPSFALQLDEDSIEIID